MTNDQKFLSHGLQTIIKQKCPGPIYDFLTKKKESESKIAIEQCFKILSAVIRLNFPAIKSFQRK